MKRVLFWVSIIFCLALFSGSYTEAGKWKKRSSRNKRSNKERIVKREFPASKIAQLLVENGAGDITVSTTEGKMASITAKKIKFNKRCKLTLRMKEDTLVAKLKQDGWGQSSSCKVDFIILIPKEISQNFQNGSGNIKVSGTSGSIDFRIGSGNVTLKGEVTELDGKTGNGAIDTSGLSGDVQIRSGSGDISLAWITAPEKGKADIKTGSGDTTVYLPETSKLHTDFMSGSGSFSTELPTVPGAPFEIIVRSGSGDLTIKKAAGSSIQ